MTYQVQFLRTDRQMGRSELFETFQQAHAHAARQQAQFQPEVIAIVEIDDNGEQGVVHEVRRC